MTRWLVLLAAIAQVGGAGHTAPDLTLSGRVVDEWGKPIAGAEVLVCADFGPCGPVIQQGATSPSSLAELAKAITPGSWSADSFAVALTRSDGTWSARIVPKRRAGDPYEVRAVVTAQHREIVERSENQGAPRPLGDDVRLRPASTLDIDPHCNASSCSGSIDVGVSPHRPHAGTHLERLAPGGYRVTVVENRNQPGERRGTAVVEATYTPRALRVPVTLQPSGTGKSIRGTVNLRGQPPREVSVRCVSGDEPVYRSTKTDVSGAFELRDVGPPPCVVELYVAGNPRVEIKALPATDLVLP
jgi:hypothetical protein